MTRPISIAVLVVLAFLGASCTTVPRASGPKSRSRPIPGWCSILAVLAIVKLPRKHPYIVTVQAGG